MNTISRYFEKILKRLKFQVLREKIAKLRGFTKDPFLYFGIISGILFSLILLLPFSEANFQHFIFSQEPGAKEENFFFLASQGLREPPDLNLVQENSLISLSPPQLVTPQVLGALIEGSNLEEIKNEILEYIVRPGDNLSSISSKFGISLNTILWANDLTTNSTLQPGQKLIILPVSGVIHHVKSGETISEIAKTYQADQKEIIAFNNLPPAGEIFVGDILIVPEGVIPKIASPIQYAPLAQSYFICPIPSPCRISQGLHWYNAIDFSNGKCSEPVFAAASGLIQKTGYQQIPGNYIRILHPNGIVTFYGHLSKILVAPGEKVSQGQIIGYTGYSGLTLPAGPAGCHLHFGVRGARNPFAR